MRVNRQKPWHRWVPNEKQQELLNVLSDRLAALKHATERQKADASSRALLAMGEAPDGVASEIEGMLLRASQGLAVQWMLWREITRTNVPRYGTARALWLWGQVFHRATQVSIQNNLNSRMPRWARDRLLDAAEAVLKDAHAKPLTPPEAE